MGFLLSQHQLAQTLAQLEIGCQIWVWLVTPLPGYRTLCSPGLCRQEWEKLYITLYHLDKNTEIFN